MGRAMGNMTIFSTYKKPFLLLLMSQLLKKKQGFILSANLMYWNNLKYIERRTYRSLKRAWIGFKIAKKDGDHDKMKYYAEGIQKFERQLRLPVSDLDILKGDARNGVGSQTTKQKEESGAANNEL